MLSQAQLIIINGLKLEEPTKELARQNKADGVAIVELGSPAIPEAEHIYDFSFPKEEGKPNPHLWTDPLRERVRAPSSRDELIRLDPAGTTTTRPTSRVHGRGRTTLADACRAAADVPAGNRKLLTYHDAYAYFAADLRLGGHRRHPGRATSRTPPPKRWPPSSSRSRPPKVPAIFGSEVFPSTVLEQIGKAAGVPLRRLAARRRPARRAGRPEHSCSG